MGKLTNVPALTGSSPVKTTGYILVTLSLHREGDQWVGLCPELGTATCGDTLDEALEALREGIALHLQTLSDVGECECFLKKQGVTVYRKKPTRQAVASERPLSLLDEEAITEERIVPIAC
jgi:predicted RNase H-like HicB family nuclease